ncbi:MAG: AAA family ATPase [Magnetococcus sp. YQC-5]
MYLDHFGLRIHPFSITPDTDLFYAGGGRGEILEQLLNAILAGEGVIKVVGDVGSGKTMLCRLLCQSLPKTVQVALLLNPNLHPEELVPAFLRELRLPCVPGMGRVAERQALLDHLVMLNRNGQRAIILIEEAQCMPVVTLEELRLLSNLETEHTKLLQIVLFGQPALDTNLHSPNTSQILERITTSLVLSPLSLTDTSHYLHSRLWGAGYRGYRLFTPGAVRCMHKVAQGGIRQINLLANKALKVAFEHGAHEITIRHVLNAIASSEFVPKRAYWHRPALVAGGLVALVAGSLAMHTWAINPSFISLDQAESTMMASALASPVLARVAQVPVASSPVASSQGASSPVASSPVASSQGASSQGASAQGASAQGASAQGASAQGASSQGASAQGASPQVASSQVAPGFTMPSRPEPASAFLTASTKISMEPVKNHSDPLQEKIQAAHQWLNSANKTNFTIQLILLKNDISLAKLEKQLTALAPPWNELPLRIFRLKNRDLMIFIHEFTSYEEGLEVMRRLPRFLQAGHPSIRNLEGVKKSIQKLAQVTPCTRGQECSHAA